VDHTSLDTLGKPAIFNEFIKWYEDPQNLGSTTSVAHSSTSFVGLTHSTSHGLWVLDSGATYHIIGNQYFFSSRSTMGYLPSVTMTNEYRVPSHGVGTINLFPSLSVIMFFMSLGLHLTYYPLVVSLVPLIVLFLLLKIMFLYRTGVRDR